MFPRLVKGGADTGVGKGLLPTAVDQSGSAARTESVVVRTGDGGTSLEPILRAALVAADIPIYVVGMDGRLRYANPSFLSLLGPAISAEIGQAADSLPQLADAFLRVKASEREVRLPQSFMTPSGLRHFIGRHRRVADPNGEFAGMVGLYVDVSEQREAERRAVQLEERFEDLARSVSDWVWETDANLNLTYASLSIAKVLGLPPQLLKGRYLFGFGCFEEAGGEGPPLSNMIELRIPFRNRRFLVNRTEGGQPCYVHLSGVPIFDDQTGRFAGYRGTGTDVTRVVLAEAERIESRQALERMHETLVSRSENLEQALTQAQAAAEAKSQFMARMSHELRTPLNAIIGFSEAASLRIFGMLNDRYADYFTNILRAGRHLLTLIEDVLDATRIDSGKLKVEPRAIRLAEVIESAWGFIHLRASAKGVKLEDAHVPGGWDLWADPVRTQQILVNLLDNAIKFTAPGGRIGIECTRRPDHAVDIVVWDTGVGIPTDQFDLIFEHFHQVQGDSLSASHGGLGLGLAISRQLARMMHGDIFVESDVGHGSRFTVRLPSVDSMA